MEVPLPLPFKCPDLVMPISGRISSQRHPVDGFEFTALSELEKKLLLGLKLVLSDDIGLETEQWIVWLAYQNGFVLHMWKPITGELKHMNMKNASVLPDFEGVTVKYLRVTSPESSFVVVNDGYPFMDELCQLIEAAVSPGMISPRLPRVTSPSDAGTQRQPPTPNSKEISIRESSLNNRETESSSPLSAEDLEKQRKRKAIGSVSMRRLSLTGRTVKKSHGGADGTTAPPSPGSSNEQQVSQLDEPPAMPPANPEFVTRRSVMSSVFGSINEDEDSTKE
jgi:hypothetical protein